MCVFVNVRVCGRACRPARWSQPPCSQFDLDVEHERGQSESRISRNQATSEGGQTGGGQSTAALMAAQSGAQGVTRANSGVSTASLAGFFEAIDTRLRRESTANTGQHETEESESWQRQSLEELAQRALVSRYIGEGNHRHKYLAHEPPEQATTDNKDVDIDEMSAVASNDSCNSAEDRSDHADQTLDTPTVGCTGSWSEGSVEGAKSRVMVSQHPKDARSLQVEADQESAAMSSFDIFQSSESAVRLEVQNEIMAAEQRCRQADWDLSQVSIDDASPTARYKSVVKRRQREETRARVYRELEAVHAQARPAAIAARIASTYKHNQKTRNAFDSAAIVSVPREGTARAPEPSIRATKKC